MPPFSMLRMRNLLNPSQGYQEGFGPTPPAPPIFNPGQINMNPPVQPPIMQQGGMNEMDEINEIMSRIYTPENEMAGRLKGLIDTMPQRTEPGLMRKIGSIAAGIGQGPEAQERILYEPYLRDMADWKAKYDPTLAAANLERQGNINERQMAYQMATASTGARRARVAEDAESRRLSKSQADIDRDRKKNDLAALKLQDANWELEDDMATGRIFAVHPRLGKKDTGLTHGEMSEIEKAKWRRGDIEAGIQGRIRVKQTPDARSGNPDDPRNLVVRDVFDEEGNPIGTVVVNKVTKKVEPVPPGTTTPGGTGPGGSVVTRQGPNANQDAKQLSNRISRYLIRHPEDRDLFENDPDTGELRPIPPGKTFGYDTGPSQEKYNQILGALGLGAGGIGRRGVPKRTKSGTVYYEEN